MKLLGALFVVLIHVPALSQINARDTITSMENILKPAYQHLQISQRIYFWEVASPRDRIPHYCSEECVCVSEELAKTLGARGIPYKILKLKMGRDFSVRLRVGNTFAGPFSHHQVLLVSFENQNWVIDPVITKSARPELYSTWYRRIERPNLKFFEISP